LRPVSPLKKAMVAPVRTALASVGMELVRRRKLDVANREDGRDWPPQAETMIGRYRLENIQHAVRTVIAEDVAGDWLETGVWRGGASIFARACLAAYGDETRTVWCADSFQGLPKSTLPEDEGMMLWRYDALSVDLDTVRRNFARYELLDDRVQFLAGWFADTLPQAPIERLAILRLDGDLYESTMDALVVYDKLSPGGYVIVDDFNIAACQAAITDFRRTRKIEATLVAVDHACVYWRKG
jgi:O-methyltransferase